MRKTTVLNGKDHEAISLLLDIHSENNNPKILDCTYNSGKMWKNLNCNVYKMDISKDFDLDVFADFCKMPFANNEFDVVVFDPPHLPTNAASKKSSKMWHKTYGITEKGFGREGDNVIGMFVPFLLEAKRVLKKNGLVLAKIADLIHNHRYQWQQVDFINAVRHCEMTACDMLIKCDPNAGKLQSSKWINVKHLRKSHCYWIVVRNSHSCEKRHV